MLNFILFFKVPADLFAHPSSFSCLLKTIFTCFLGARMCWPLHCLCRPFCIFEMSDLYPESCRSKQTRYCNLATHLPNQLSHPSLDWLLKTFPNEKCSYIKSLAFFTISNFSHWKKLPAAELDFERRWQTLIMKFSLCSCCYL